MPSNTDSITITASNNSPFAPQDSSVAAQGTVKFLGSSGTVNTLVSGTATQVFTSGVPPYTVPNSTGYTLLSTISGDVTLEFTSSTAESETGVNGTINVGGTNGDPE